MIDAITGGILIGISATLMMFGLGRIAGNSGIIGGLFTLGKDKAYWRLFYVFGLVAGGVIYRWLGPKEVEPDIWAPPAQIIIAGLLVGFGTRWSGGCTSGHGVCGLARLSVRSLTATAVFMASAILTVYLVKQF